MKRLKLWYLLVLCVSFLVTPAAYAQLKVSLTLTYPAGKSPNVFTEGWVFGARAIADPGGPTERDVSSTVRWTGSGTFHPAVGKTSRPIFAGPGPNSITLSVTVDGQTVTEQVSVNAVSPYVGNTKEPLYAALGDLAHSPADGHGAPADPLPVTGPIITGSPNVTVDGRPAARKGDDGIHASCSGQNIFKIAEGDPNVLIDGRPAARIGDKTHHCGGIGKIIGPLQAYYVVFQVTAPAVKEDRKPRKRTGESDQAWQSRRKQVYLGMTSADFYFKENAIEKTSFVVRISDKAVGRYPKDKFIEDSQWVAQVDYSGTDASGQAFKLKTPVLLTVRGNYTSKENMYGFHPTLKGKKNLRIFQFSQRSGLVKMEEGPARAIIGPITAGWSAVHKQESIRAAKTVLANFDCFVAHITYSGADLHKINTFRDFRDKILQQTEAGRHLVRLYYEYGFDYAARLRNRPGYIPAVRAILDRVASYVEGLDLEDPETIRNLNREIHWIDLGASLFFEEGASEGLGQFSRFMVPILWEK